MESFDELKGLIPLNPSDLSLSQTFVSFILCMIMSFIVREFYMRRSYSLTGKNHIGSILPLLSGVVFLVIVVVKSSLALSLGLVGALSIVRFRTPIKEPEELVYLFLAISVGLGYAAGQIVITTMLVTSILLFIYFWLSNRNGARNSEYNLVINWQDEKVSFASISNEVKGLAKDLKLVRLDRMKGAHSAVMLLSPTEGVSLDSVVEALTALDPAVRVSFYEAKTNW